MIEGGCAPENAAFQRRTSKAAIRVLGYDTGTPTKSLWMAERLDPENLKRSSVTRAP